MNENETIEPVRDVAKRWIPEQLSIQIYRCLRDLYPYEKELIGKHPEQVIEIPGMYVIRLCDNMGYMQDMEISIHQLIAQNMTRKQLVHEFLGLMREALNTQDKQRNGETP